MSRFVNRAATDEIVLANGDRVQVRQRLTAAEAAELNRNLVHLRYDQATKEMSMTEGDWHRQRIVIAHAYILGWTFADDEGRPVPFEPRLIDDLDDDTVNEICEAIDQLQTRRREGLAKNA